MKRKVLLLCVLCLCGIISHAEQNFYVTLGQVGCTSSIITTELQDDNYGYLLTTTGVDPFVATSTLPRDLTSEEVTVRFEYKCSNGVPDCELFFSTGLNNFVGGNEMSFSLDPADDWTPMQINIAYQRGSYDWGYEGDNLRFDIGNEGGHSVYFRNITFVTPDDVFISKYEGFEEDIDGYYLLKKAEDIEKVADYVAKGKCANVRLANDIDYSGHNTLIGTSSNKTFYTTFDGAGHTITVDFNRTTDDAALFDHLAGTVKNLTIIGNVNTSAKYAASFVVNSYAGSKLQNCAGGVNVQSSLPGDGTHGGLVALNVSGLTLENCIYFGTMKGSNTCYCGGLVGWSSVTTTMNNCIFAGDLHELGATGSYTFSRNPEKVDATNCYYIQQYGDLNPGTKQIIGDNALTSGAACYQANGEQSHIIWYQTLGEDTHPVPYSKDHQQVYASGSFRCDGVPTGEVTYTNTVTESPIPAHSYEDGVCSVCGHEETGFVEIVDDWYQITTPEQLVWFSNVVNKGSGLTLKARLMNDINMTGYKFNPIGNKEANPFSGTFDGQGHTINGLTIEQSENCAGLLGYVKAPVTIQDLTLDENCSISGGSFCGLVGESVGITGLVTLKNLGNEGTVTGTGNNIAGIFGCCMNSSATIIMSNCYVTGDVTGQKECGILSGWFGNAGSAKNCWTTATLKGADSDANYLGRGSCSYDNCWSVNGAQCNIFPLEETATGALCFKMNNGDVETPTWYQTIGKDGHPVLDSSHGVVYQEDDYRYACFYDESTFATFRTSIVAFEKAQLQDVVAMKSVLDDCKDALDRMSQETEREAFFAKYADFKTLKEDVEISAQAYQQYQEKVNFVIKYLTENTDFQGVERDLLVKYLEETLEPCEEFPNGSYPYIWDIHELTNEGITEESNNVIAMLDDAISNDYMAGTDITRLLSNADFIDAFNGWEGKLATGTGVSDNPTISLIGAECWNDTFDMHQTLTGMKDGVYLFAVNGSFRPNNTVKSTNYAASIYANDNMVFLPAVCETYIPVNLAQDGINCHLTGDTPDFELTNENGELIGYAMQGCTSISNAAYAGRARNYILADVKDGTLTVGIKSPGTGLGSDWTGFAGVTLIYLGSMEQANEYLNATLEGQVARATTLLNAEIGIGEDYAQHPNFSQNLKDELNNEIAQATSVETPEAKYDLIARFSQTLTDVYNCKQAYINMLRETDNLFAMVDELHPVIVSDEDFQTVTNAQKWAWDGYVDGSISTQEAQELAQLKSASSYLSQENGVYQINNTVQFAVFAGLVNMGVAVNSDAVLNADIDYCTEKQMMKTYRGTLSGNYHTITVNMNRSENDCALFQDLYGTVENLIVRGTLTESAKFAAGVAAHSYGAHILGVQSYVDIISTTDGDGTHGGILGVNETEVTLENCLFAGSMKGEQTTCCGGFIGWSSGKSYVNNCLQIGDIQTSSAGSDTFGRRNDYVFLKNCYYKDLYGEVGSGATQITTEQLKSGEVCFMLNDGEIALPVWRQNLGADEWPVPDVNRQIVDQNENGEFENNVNTGMALHAGTADDPFPISSLTDLKSMHGLMRSGEHTYFTLENDIDMSTIKNWTPLNMDTDTYEGKTWMNWIDFDGKGHVINNFSCSGGDYASFFGILCGNVRNIGFENVNVESSNTGTGVLGGYIGHNNYTDADGNKQFSTVENTWVTGKLTVTRGGKDYCGGLVGNIGGPSIIHNCYVNLDIQSDASFVGGIVGRVRDALTMENIYAAGAINKGNGIVGGGQNENTPISIYKNCVVWNNTDSNFGTTVEADEVSGIVYYDGNNFVELQNTVVNWGTPWTCDMEEGSYPVISANATNVKSIPVANDVVDSTKQNIYLLDGRMVRRGTENKNGLSRGFYIIGNKKTFVK